MCKTKQKSLKRNESPLKSLQLSYYNFFLCWKVYI